MADARPPGLDQAGEPAVTESAASGPGAADPRSAGPAPGGAARRAARRRRTPWRAAFFALAALAIIGGVGYALLGNRVLIVRSVTVTGTHLVTSAQVRAAADVPDGTPLLRVDTAAVERRVAAIRQVASVTVTKDWPDRLAIAVTERVPALAVRMAGGGYDLIDHDGVIVRWDRAKPAALPLLVTSLPGGQLRGDPGVAAASAVLGELKPWLAGSVARVAVSQVLTGVGAQVRTAQQVTLFLSDHKTVLWGGTDRAALKNRELAILMRGSARYFDVSAPGIVVTR